MRAGPLFCRAKQATAWVEAGRSRSLSNAGFRHQLITYYPRGLEQYSGSGRVQLEKSAITHDWEDAIREGPDTDTRQAISTVAMAAWDSITIMGEDVGTGSGFGRLVLILAGVSSLIACLLTVLYVSPTRHYCIPSRRNTRLTLCLPLAPPSYNARTTASLSCSAMSSESSCWCPSSALLPGPV